MNLRRVVAGCVVLGGLLQCGGAPGSGAGGPVGQEKPAVEAMDHEPCDSQGHQVESFDTRGDGKPVVLKVKDASGHEICRVTDINHDGKPDLYEYFDASGQLRRIEADYDSNGSIDSVEVYEDGKLVQRKYDTTGQHRVDTWDFFDKATGKRVRRERDTTNDGKVDQWWVWSGDRVTVAFDTNGDGKPDPGAVVVLDAKTGGPIKEAKDAPPGAPAASSSSAPPGSAAASAVSSSSAPPGSAAAPGSSADLMDGLKLTPGAASAKPSSKHGAAKPAPSASATPGATP